MTKVTIDPGVCGFITRVTAQSPDGLEVVLSLQSGCAAVRGILPALGDTFDSYELCLEKPGSGPLYDYACQAFPGHCACPVLAGITKAAEVECKLALPKNAAITFED